MLRLLAARAESQGLKHAGNKGLQREATLHPVPKFFGLLNGKLFECQSKRSPHLGRFLMNVSDEHLKFSEFFRGIVERDA